MFDFQNMILIMTYLIVGILISILSVEVYNYVAVNVNGTNGSSKIIAIREELARGKNHYYIKSKVKHLEKSIYHEELCFFYKCPYEVGDTIKIKYINSSPIKIYYEPNYQKRIRGITILIVLIIPSLLFVFYLKRK